MVKQKNTRIENLGHIIRYFSLFDDKKIQKIFSVLLNIGLSITLSRTTFEASFFSEKYEM